ncbi:DNA-binding protein [Streptomyces sp. NPDC006743]|uniref:DNA-binding protein n=1 Tax=Streptomyces sp. NPDC006743 TaxID=3154480 RepID=UPI003452FED3
MNGSVTEDGTTAEEAVAEAATEELLRAGAVLPPGAAAPEGARAVPMLTQAYRHPALDDRLVVRLVAAEPGQDPGAGFLGLEPEGEAVEVGLGRPRALGFPEWVLVHQPADGHLAMSVAEEMDTIARTARSRPKKARAAYEAIGERLAGAVPHFLPTFYEQAGRVFLAADEKRYASLMFVNARKAETAYALPFDEGRMDAVFLEFSLAGAVPANMLSSYAKGLSSRVAPETAFRHLRGLFVRLAEHGLAPSSPGAGELRRLAKEVAGKDALTQETGHLREMLVQPGTEKAPPGWWKAHRRALLELTREEPAFRGVLLGLMPAGWERDELPQWLALLEDTGATAGLCDTALPAEVRPPDGASGWVRRLLRLVGAHTPAEVHPLIDRMADALRTEMRTDSPTGPHRVASPEPGTDPRPDGEAGPDAEPNAGRSAGPDAGRSAGPDAEPDAGPGVRGEPLPAVHDVNLLDQLLALGVPVADPGPRHSLSLTRWAADENRRDLRALEADRRFRPAFRRSCPTGRGKDDLRTLTVLAASPGGRPMLAEWAAEVARRYIPVELAGFSASYARPLQPLDWLPGETLALAEDAVREALSTGMAPALARSLRSGIIDELGWPAWEEAVAAAGEGQWPGGVHVTDAWPHLVVLTGTHARVIDARGTVHTHELRLPPEVTGERSVWGLGAVGCRYVDGELFVWWSPPWPADKQGYWERSAPVPFPADPAAVRCDSMREYGRHMPSVALPLPGGGLTTGTGVLRPGDTAVPEQLPVISDGTSYWVRDDGWYAYDPLTGTCGAPAMPEWFARGLRDAPPGSVLARNSRLLPAPSAAPGPLCAPVDGLVGWRVVELPDGSLRGEDLAGRSVVVRQTPPHRITRELWHALQFPGTDRPVAVVQDGAPVSLYDADGTLMAQFPEQTPSAAAQGRRAGFAAGSALLPPLRYWHLLQPRDPRGSAALRGIDEDTAAALLAAAVAEPPEDDAPAGAAPGTGGGPAPQQAGAAGRDRLPGLIRTLLPQVTREALRAGIAGVVRLAATHQRTIDAARTRLDAAAARLGPAGGRAGGGEDTDEDRTAPDERPGENPRNEQPTGPGPATGRGSHRAPAPGTGSDRALDAGSDRLLGSDADRAPGTHAAPVPMSIPGADAAPVPTSTPGTDAAPAPTSAPLTHAAPAVREVPGDATLAAVLDGLGLLGTFMGRSVYYDHCHHLVDALRLIGRSLRGRTEPVPAGHVHVTMARTEPLDRLNWWGLSTLPATVALRAASAATADDDRKVLDCFLAELDDQNLSAPGPGHWRRARLRLADHLFEGPDALPPVPSSASVLDLGGGEFLLFPGRWYSFPDRPPLPATEGREFDVIHHDPEGRFRVPAPYTLVHAEPFTAGPVRAPGWLAALRADLAGRGPAPWHPGAAEEFARLTGVTPTMARLVVAGLPMIDDERVPVPAGTLKSIGVKAADAQIAKDILRTVDGDTRRAVVAALLPAEPARLWTDGPDASAAARVWNERVGRRTPLDEDVLHDAVRTVSPSWWDPYEALHAFLHADGEPKLTRDLEWRMTGYGAPSAEGRGFGSAELKGAVALAAWLAHRLPSGDPLRATLPRVLAAVRERLAHPGLLIRMDRWNGLDEFRRILGEPTETGEDFERYGAVVLSTRILGTGSQAVHPAIRPVLLDETGSDPRLPLLFPGEGPTAEETALRVVHDERFAKLLADPGAPAAGGPGEGGTWWPQNPALSVPGLVADAAGRYGIGEDAAVLYLMLVALPDPTDRNTARWTGWSQQRGGTARLRAARAELAATALVVRGTRTRAGRSLFLPGGWLALAAPHTPLERWKLPLYDLLHGEKPALGVVVPTRPVADLYRQAWQRVLDGDEPRLDEIDVPRPRDRRRRP